MKRLLVAIAALVSTVALSAQTPQALTGRWLLTCDFYGTTRYYRLDLDAQSGRFSGTFDGTALSGALSGGRLTLSGESDGGALTTVDATIQGAAFAGTVAITTPGDVPLSFRFSATPIPPLARTAPTRHEFVPTVFYRDYSPFHQPALTINPGDTVHTTTVDAGGNDERNVKRVAGGNPQTGPFYIRGAVPGDTLVVHLDRLRLNRDSAGSDDRLVRTALGPDLAIKTRDNNSLVSWRLDLARHTATPQRASDHLTDLAVPLHPMLGCIATAYPPGTAAPASGDSGFTGGNLDFNEISEGATIYLPVVNPGALLYLGDAHALQGDGELNGNALETSMDVEFTVDLIPGRPIRFVRVETAQAIVALGYAGSLDDAFRDATSNMAEWIVDDYRLTPSEVAQFLGVAAQYEVTEVADRNSGIALKIDKALLRQLKR